MLNTISKHKCAWKKRQIIKIYLKQTSTTCVGSALAEQHFTRNTAHVVVVVPGQLSAGANVR